MTTEPAPALPAGGPSPSPRHRRPADGPQPTEAAAGDPELVVTVAPTVMDGLVVRWYRGLTEAGNRDEFVSASRTGVLIRGYLHQVPPAVLAAAQGAFETLRDGGDPGPVRALATHRRRLGRGLLPVVFPDDAPPTQSGDGR